MVSALAYMHAVLASLGNSCENINDTVTGASEPLCGTVLSDSQIVSAGGRRGGLAACLLVSSRPQVAEFEVLSGK